MMDLFTWLTKSLEGSAVTALTASFVWGILSLILSPCHLASIPLIVGFIDNQGQKSSKHAFRLAGIFSFGILITIASVGLITGLLGRLMGDIGRTGDWIISVIFIIIGLHLMEIISIPFLGKSGQPAIHRKGAWAAFILGLVFGLAVGPCSFAFMAPMLGIVFRIASEQLLFSITLILAYAVGHCLMIVLAGTFTGWVQNYLNWNEHSKGAIILRKGCGFIVILAAIYLIVKTI